MNKLTASLTLGIITVTVLISVGCASVLSTMMYAVGADLQPAEYDRLEGKRVAVVVVTDGSFRNDPTVRLLPREISEKLEVEVKGIELVREEEVDSWRDSNEWSQIDYVSLGRGVKADKVIGVEVIGLSLRENATLFRATADVTTTVYDVKSGKKEFRKHLEDFKFPTHTGKYVSDTTEMKFRRNFLVVLGNRIASYFHRYDPKDTFALDAAIVNL